MRYVHEEDFLDQMGAFLAVVRVSISALLRYPRFYLEKIASKAQVMTGHTSQLFLILFNSLLKLLIISTTRLAAQEKSSFLSLVNILCSKPMYLLFQFHLDDLHIIKNTLQNKYFGD